MVARSQDAKAVKAYETLKFLWGFLVAWKQVTDHADKFVKKQQSLLAMYEKKSVSADPLSLPKAVNAPLPQQLAQVKEGEVGLRGGTKRQEIGRAHV